MAKKLSGVEVFEQAEPSVLRPGEAVLALGKGEDRSVLSGPNPVMLALGGFAIAYLFGIVALLAVAGIIYLVDRKMYPRPVKGSLAARWPSGRHLIGLTTQRLLVAPLIEDRPVKKVKADLPLESIRRVDITKWRGRDLLVVEFVDGSRREKFGEARWLAAQYQISTGQSASTLPPPPPMESATDS